MRVAAVLLSLPALASAAGLVDDPIAADSIKYLDSAAGSSWTATSSAGFSIDASVPGDLLTDLEAAGKIGDPLYELNWLNSTIWNNYTWTYATSFSMPGGAGTPLLVFDGIKMGAKVMLNGKLIATATDQFMRYVFPLEKGALLASNKLEVVFDPAIDCAGRWMACTGGWDWAPYTNTHQDGIPTMTKGIWKSVSIVEVGSAAITAVVPQIFYSGDYPMKPLTDETHEGFAIDVKVFTWAAAETKGTLSVTGSWGKGTEQVTVATQAVTVPKGNASTIAKLTAGPGTVKLWWPAGHGSQPLYNISVTFTPAAVATAATGVVSATRRVGFRHFAVVTGDDTDAAYVKASKGKEGTDKLGMLWRINGAAIFSKGANMIPMEELEGRMAANAHHQLVQTAVDGGMNTLRVWGGGMFLPNAWYDACDELGIMVYHDMQYAQGGHSPKNDDVQDAELRHQIRRLSSHASIVLWDGCNECRVLMGTNTGIYATFVMTVVAEEDKSRSIWPSCPALGWTAGVDKLTARPTGTPLSTPKGGFLLETHGPYQHGTGFPAVNGAGNMQPVSPHMNGGMPITMPSGKNGTTVGLGEKNIFASEFGSSVYSSFESMSPTLAKDHWGIHGGGPADTCKGGFASKCQGTNVMAQRNYPCDNIIDEYFGLADADAVGELVFKKQLWQCMVGQSLLLKSDIETRRSTNQFGIIVWQLNEIWPTGGWGSIEYGTVTHTKGQVLGGRWKPLHHWYKKSVYADVMATCGAVGGPDSNSTDGMLAMADGAEQTFSGGASCYVKNDSPKPFKGTVDVSTIALSTGKVTSSKKVAVDMPAGAGVTQWFNVEGAINGGEEMLNVVVTGSDGTVTSDNPVPFAYPKNMKLPKATVNVTVGEQLGNDIGAPVSVTVTSDALALYTTLTTLAQGRFEDNAFLMLPGTKTLSFYPFEGFDAAELKSTIRVEHAALYM